MLSRDKRLSRTKERSVKVNASRGFITTHAQGTYKGAYKGVTAEDEAGSQPHAEP